MYVTVELGSIAADAALLAPGCSPRAIAMARAAASNPAATRAAAVVGLPSIGMSAATASMPIVIPMRPLLPTAMQPAREERYSARVLAYEQHKEWPSDRMTIKRALTTETLAYGHDRPSVQLRRVR